MSYKDNFQYAIKKYSADEFVAKLVEFCTRIEAEKLHHKGSLQISLTTNIQAITCNSLAPKLW